MSRRWLALIVLAAGSLIAVATLGESRKPVQDPQLRPSILFTDETGGRAFYLLLQETLGRDAAIPLSGPLNELRPVKGPAPDTLIVAGPQRALDNDELYRLDEWLEEGGQLLLASDDGWECSDTTATFLEAHGVSMGHSWALSRTVHLDDDGNTLLYFSGSSNWEGESTEVLARAGDEVVAVTIPVGKGRIVALADPSLITNKALASADNGVWLYHLVADWGDGKAMFDEHHLGLSEASSLIGSIKAFLLSPWGLPFLQTMLLGLAYLILGGRRLGRSIELPPEPVNEPLLLVQARAGLLEAASARSLAVSRYAYELSHQLRSPGGQPRDLATLEGSDLRQFLQIQQRAEEGKASDTDLLTAAQLAYEIREDVLRGSEHRS